MRDSSTRLVVGRSIPNASKRALSALAIRKPPAIPSSAPSSADRHRLDHHRGEDLPPRGAERAQHPEFADPLGDGDREGVEDQEGADEDGDEAEDEEEGLQEAEVVADFFRAAVGVFLRGLDPDPGRHPLGDPPFQRRRPRRPSSAATEIWSKRPRLWVSRWATGSVTWAMLAPPKEALPSWVKPTSRKVSSAALADQLDLFARASGRRRRRPPCRARLRSGRAARGRRRR